MILRLDKKKLYISLFLFMFIFMPPIIPDINILYLLDIFAALAIITKYKSEYLVLSSNRYFSFFQISFYIFGVTTILHNIYDWTMGNRLENGEYITNIYRIVGVAILISVCSICCMLL